jgi:nitrate/nitrite transporter NarK
MKDPPEKHKSVAARHIAAVVAGNALEFYDFLTYSFFAVYIGRAFFPSSDPSASLLASLATFGAGFVTRPIGALVIGRMGDRLGRKPAIILSFWLMGIAISGLALTPPRATIGSARARSFLPNVARSCYRRGRGPDDGVSSRGCPAGTTRALYGLPVLDSRCIYPHFRANGFWTGEHAQ